MSSQSASSEITSKIRSAIKAKLTELGAYVDEELPDYIMVMIANKKSKQQMAEDLNLFLGKSAAVFTDWLQNVLDRLQSIGRSNAATNVVQAVSQSVVDSATTSKDSKTSSSKEKRKRSPDRKKKSPKKSSRKKERDSNDDGSDSSVERKRKIRTEKKEAHQPKKARSEKSSSDDDGKKVKGSSAKLKAPILPQKSAPSNTLAIPDEDVLVVRVDIDDGDELASEMVGDLQARNVGAPKENRHLSQPVIFRDTTSTSISNISMPSTVRKPIEAPSPDISTRRHVGTVRPMKRRTPSPSEGPPRKRRSTIGQVIQNTESSVLNEEYDPLHPQIGLPGSVASTVRVTERKYPVPKEMQPKPSIFLRALNDANRSVKIVRGGAGYKEEQDPEPLEQETVVTVRRRHVEESTTTGKGQSVFNRIPKEARVHRESSEERSTGPSTSGRRIQLRSLPQQSTTVAPTSMSEDDGDPDQDCLIVSEVPESTSEKKTENPRFVVTMAGIDRKFVQRVSIREETEEDRLGKTGDPVDYDDLDTLIVDVDEDEMMEEAMMGFGGLNKGSTLPAALQTPTTQIVNPIKISLDDDDDDDESEEKIDTIVVSADSPANTNDSAIGSPRVVDDTALYGIEHIPNAAGGDKILERCRFWPNCKLGASCQFMHPTTTCKNFPQCHFGDKCLYIHPPCKFDTYCKNPRCPFTHNRPAPLSQLPMRQAPPPRFAPFQNQSGFVPCKFGGRCLNLACAFRHPQTRCMYGPACTKPNCAYSHRPVAAPPYLLQESPDQQPRPVVVKRPLTGGRTDTTKFRWTAPQQVSAVVGKLIPEIAKVSNEMKQNVTPE